MNKISINKFIQFLKKKYLIYAPVREGDELYVKEIEDIAKIDFSRQIPINTYKHVLLAERQVLFNFDKGNLKEIKEASPPECAFLMSIMDLDAVGLFHQIFEKDPYYQAKRQKTLLVGQAFFDKSGFAGHLKDNYEENILEHLIFDILLVKVSENRWKLFTGSMLGQRTLDDFGYKNYEHIQFEGLIREEGPDPQMPVLKKKVESSYGKKIWDYWGNRCLACGKCAVNCPTCFCFNIFDEQDIEKKEKGKRIREWTTCFYNDFSEVGGGLKFLDTNAKRIYNWYCHKWVRIPKEFSIIGCVNCGRCDKVCPVGIKRSNVLKSLDKPDQVKPDKED